MKLMSRRSVIRGSLGLTATGMLARPYIANAAASTATVWQVQGFVPEEDAAFRKTVADYEKASGNKIDLSIMPFTALNQKVISALTSGEVPDLIFHDAPATILPQNAWDNKLEDVSDVVEAAQIRAQRDRGAGLQLLQQRHEAACLLPCADQAGCEPFHIWGDLVETGRLQAVRRAEDLGRLLGFLQADAEGTARQGACASSTPWACRSPPSDRMTATVCSRISWSPTAAQNIVTTDGKLHTDDPQVREAAIRSVEYMTNCYKEGYVPPEALSWNDADDNNAYHEKLFVMDLDGTLSTELAMIKNKKAYYEEIGDDGTAEPQ